MGVSINGDTPKAGWFLSCKIPKWMMWRYPQSWMVYNSLYGENPPMMGYLHFRKPPNPLDFSAGTRRWNRLEAKTWPCKSCTWRSEPWSSWRPCALSRNFTATRLTGWIIMVHHGLSMVHHGLSMSILINYNCLTYPISSMGFCPALVWPADRRSLSW